MSAANMSVMGYHGLRFGTEAGEPIEALMVTEGGACIIRTSSGDRLLAPIDKPKSDPYVAYCDGSGASTSSAPLVWGEQGFSADGPFGVQLLVSRRGDGYAILANEVSKRGFLQIGADTLRRSEDGKSLLLDLTAVYEQLQRVNAKADGHE